MPAVTIVGTQHLLTNDPNAKNILFLGDGFSTNDRKLFFDVVEEFNLRFFRVIEPFNLAGQVGSASRRVRNHFNIFAAFTPTPAYIAPADASGISSAWPLDVNHEPVPPADPTAAGDLAEKQSFFGMQYEGRGLSLKAAQVTSIVDFITTLTHPLEAVSAIPDCWDALGAPSFPQPNSGKDRGLVVVLVNDDPCGGTALRHPTNQNILYAGAVTVGRGTAFNVIRQGPGVGGGILFEHTPLPKLPRTISGRMRHPVKFNQINDVIAHELAHSRFGLADEYVGGEAHDPTAGSPASPLSEDNVTARNHAIDGVGDFKNVLWRADMLPAVKTHVETVGPLHVETCSGIALGTTLPYDTTRHLPPGPLRPLAKRPADIVGLYEGARYQQCGIFRPAGRCKMRKTADILAAPGLGFRAWRFCYICKKTIIQDIDPTLLPLLHQKQYPR